MKNTDLRTEFTAETQKRFNVEWIAYNDYAEWLEQKLVKLLTITPVSNSLDLRELERKLDEALGKETRETLTEWLKQQRQ